MNYAQLAKQRIRKPQPRPPRILVYGRNKRGKTRFCATAPNVLILDPEDGTGHEARLAPDVWPVQGWGEWQSAYEFLKAGGHGYKWVCLDGIPKIYNQAMNFVRGTQEAQDANRKPGMTQIQDYGKANEAMKTLLWNFHSLRDLGVIFTSQERMEEVEELGETDDDIPQITHRVVADVPNGCRGTMYSVVDLTGRLYVVRGDFTRRVRDRETGKVREIQTHTERRLWIAPHEMYDTGYRSEWELPDMLPNPKVTTLMKTIREGDK